MKIEIQIGCDLDCVDIARSILENMDASKQKVILMSSAVKSGLLDFDLRLVARLKTELKYKYEAKISNAHYSSLFHWFDVDYKGKKSVVSVANNHCSLRQNDGFDIVHFYGCEIFFDGLDGFSSDEFMSLCSGAHKIVAYFSEPYVATFPCVNMLQGLMNMCDVSFVYHPRTGKVIDGEIDGDFGVCGECSRRVFVDRPEELCSEVHLKMMDKDEASRKSVGEDVGCTTCARKYRADGGWRLAVNKRCPYYAEHFVSEVNNGM